MMWMTGIAETCKTDHAMHRDKRAGSLAQSRRRRRVTQLLPKHYKIKHTSATPSSNKTLVFTQRN